MNERIRELANQCYNLSDAPEALYYRKFDHEKFAELIVRECIEVSQVGSITETKLKEHFGVE